MEATPAAVKDRVDQQQSDEMTALNVISYFASNEYDRARN
jgi:hypothetical protein